MEQREVIVFIIIGNVILLVFIAGIIAFFFQYRKRKILHEQEKRRMEETHRLALLQSQLDTQRQTMQFIGSEIHDSVNQKLTLAALYTQRLEFQTQYPEVKTELQGVSGIINDTLLELKNLSRSLTDHQLQTDGLHDILHHECEQVSRTGLCKARFEGLAVPVVSATIKSSLLRIVQEFIQNSLKHAACKQIFIRLHWQPGEGLSLLLEDDGRGFDRDAMRQQGMGLNNIERRVGKIGGRYQLETAEGKGTRMEVFISEIIIQQHDNHSA
jgi:signal transduction histidine kinase